MIICLKLFFFIYMFFTLLFCPECWYSVRAGIHGIREKIPWPEKVFGEVVEERNWWLKPQLLNYC